MIRIVVASRLSRERFAEDCMLGRCLPRLAALAPLGVHLFAHNERALGACYNEALAQASDDDVLVFVHDDVFIHDWMFAWRVQEALMHFDVVGIAGNARRQQAQETWYLQPSRLGGAFDRGHLHGALMHGEQDSTALTLYGPTPAPVRLLDGLMLVARAGTLRQAGVAFDPALGFHLYDLDFCRAAEAAGLRLGVWPLAVTHRSGGESVRSQAWSDACRLYFQKYQELDGV